MERKACGNRADHFHYSHGRDSHQQQAPRQNIQTHWTQQSQHRTIINNVNKLKHITMTEFVSFVGLFIVRNVVGVPIIFGHWSRGMMYTVSVKIKFIIFFKVFWPVIKFFRINIWPMVISVWGWSGFVLSLKKNKQIWE